MKNALWLSVVVIGACGQENGVGECEGEKRRAYPSGPFGTTTDQVIANLEFTTQDNGKLTLQQLRADVSQKLLVLATGAEWCVACKAEQPTLQAWHESYADDGLVVMVAVNEDAYHLPADAQEATNWAASQSLTFEVVADPEFVLEAYFPDQDASVQPLNMIVELCTMEIIRSAIGSDPSATEAIIEARL